MAGNKLGSNPSSKGWKPPSNREHPPKAGAHDCGPVSNHGGGYGAGGSGGPVSPPPHGVAKR